ncbi:MAG: hypothetical protein ACLPVY_22710 [Acidimicrobiia bacterium]
MKNSVALLIAARAELAVRDNRDVIVSNLCRTFDVGPDDALAVIAAAQLLADQPGRDSPFDDIDGTAIPARFVADQPT